MATTTLTEQLKMIQDAYGKMLEASELWHDALKASREETHVALGDARDADQAANAFGRILTDAATAVSARRDEVRRAYDETPIVQFVLTDGASSRKVACMKPNDYSDVPWITESVYNAVRKMFTPKAVLRCKASGQRLNVLDRSNRIVATVDPL